MHKYAAAVPLLVALAFPLVASAHERQVFEIKGKQYQFVVGSLGEPLVVDDKSGVDLRVSTLPNGKPVEGLQDSLKVELIAGDNKKELPFDAVYGTPGSYKAVFFPTIATSLSYRIFGTIDSVPFNVTFTCQSGGETATEDTSRTNISDGVVRVMKTGAFGCPEPKADLGFPEFAPELHALLPKSSNNGLAEAALALAAVAFVVAVAKRRS